MKVGIIGSGGREHAICESLKNSKKIDKLFCFPGNAGTANIAENININTNRNIEVMNISNRIMNIFPESHSDSVIYTYSSSPTIFDAINSPSSSNLLRN